MSALLSEKPRTSDLDFVWVELTNQCNLHCVHCYSESSPYSSKKDLLTEDDYIKLIHEVKELGCTNIQFIGGEPTLNHSLPNLIEEASRSGFVSIEVFTNLIKLPDSLLKIFTDFNVSIATSFYSCNKQTHDDITTHKGSFRRTLNNIERVLDSGLNLRAGIIVMDQNRNEIKETWEFLESLGIKNIGTDNVRNIGRANESKECGMDELCGSCAGNILSIGPDGVVAPCNMSKKWSVGSVLTSKLKDIAKSDKLLDIRRQIGESVKEKVKTDPQAICKPKTCPPYGSCCPSTQLCAPCAPNGCIPCYPKG